MINIFLYMILLYCYGTKEKLNPAVVKVDDHKKPCLTTLRFIDNCNLSVVDRRKKENREIVMTALARPIETTYTGIKKTSRNRPWIFFPVFCCTSNLLVLWVVSSLSRPSEQTHKIRTCKLMFPYIFAACIQIYVFTLSSLTLHSKNRIIPSLPPGVSRINIPFRRFHTCIWETSSFPS